jgi:hypothetical protein
LFWLVVLITPSRALNSILVFLFVSWTDRVTTDVLPALFMNRNFTLAFTSVASVIVGSFTKLWPFEHVGGRAPVQAYFKDSMMLVFPQPLAPTIIVNGE